MDGSLSLDALEDRIERRLTALELRHQRQVDRLQAQRDQDATSLEEAGTVLQRCEQDLEVVTEWQREAAQRFAAVETRRPDPRIDEALEAVQSGKAICEESRAAACAAVASFESRMSELAAKLADLDARLLSQDDAVQKAVQSKEGDRKLERTVERTSDHAKELKSRLEALEQRVMDQQEDLVDLRERWAEQEVERTEVAAQIETRLTRFEGTMSNFTDDLSMKAAEARSDLRSYFEQQVGQATSSLEASSTAIAETREAMKAEVMQLLAERSAMRSAWTRIEALRHDATWGYFLGDNAEWKSWRDDITRQVQVMEQKDQGHAAIWSEIGQLGCRVADVHHLLDECLPVSEVQHRRVPQAAVSRNGRGTVQAFRERPRSLSVRRSPARASSKPAQGGRRHTPEQAGSPRSIPRSAGVVDEDDTEQGRSEMWAPSVHHNSGLAIGQHPRQEPQRWLQEAAEQDMADEQRSPMNTAVRPGRTTSSRFPRRVYADEDLSNLLVDT